MAGHNIANIPRGHVEKQSRPEYLLSMDNSCGYAMRAASTTPAPELSQPLPAKPASSHKRQARVETVTSSQESQKVLKSTSPTLLTTLTLTIRPIMNLSSILHLQPPSYERKKHYEFGRDLGTGTYGTVKKAKSLDTGNDVAVKIILKKTVKGHEDMVEKEIGVLKNLSHPNIVNFLDCPSKSAKGEPSHACHASASGGELFDRICEQGRFTENNAATIMKEVISAIEYLHSKNVVHRDLKPENLLYKDNTPDSKLMIVDFGISKTMESEDQVLTTMCGSYGYAAPEVLLRKGHGKPVDMWSIGVDRTDTEKSLMSFNFFAQRLCGYAPFQAENDQQLVAEIARCNVVFHERYWRDVSVEGKHEHGGVDVTTRDFIKCLLRAHPEKRLTATEALQHKWITTETGTGADLLDNVKEGFNAKRVFKKSVRAIAAANRLRAMTRSGTDATNFASDVDGVTAQTSQLAVSDTPTNPPASGGSPVASVPRQQAA
ncbi:hypothetical protein BGZ94_002279 [Podila epigama]|nr:hypothetical protein BGZ94_002279 [Podila epigama]